MYYEDIGHRYIGLQSYVRDCIGYRPVDDAYNDSLQDYKDTIPHLFHTNAFIILSKGTDAKVDTVTSTYKFFLDWKRIEEEEEGIVSLDIILQGTCAPHRLMDIFENFLIFDESNGNITTLMGKNLRLCDNTYMFKDMQMKSN
jgi:type I site-specific restriction-modification system R (restriction) subunit